MAISFRTARNLGLSILLLMIILAGLLPYSFMEKTITGLFTIVTVEEVKLKKWGDLFEIISDSKDRLYDYRLGRTEVVAPVILLINRALIKIEEIRDLSTDEEELASIDEIEREIKTFNQAVFAYKSEVREGYRGGASAMEMEKIALRASDGIVQLSRAAVEDVSKRIENKNAVILSTAVATQRMLWLILIIGAAVSVATAIIVARTLSKPINELILATQRLAEGELSYRARVDSKDEIGQLGSFFNKMADSLQKTTVSRDELEKAYRELRDTQTMLVQSEKLSALGELGAGVAHELNSPLAGVLSLLRTYLKGKDPNSEEYEDLKDMEEACEHMAKIIKDFSTFTRKSTGEFTDVNIIDVIESTLSFSARQIEKQGIRIEKSYDNALPLVKGDESLLRQVVLNMITNARDAISGEGTLKIVTRESNTDKGQFVEVEFSDTGVGINKEDIEKIFDPFFTTKRPGKGVGLGLSITHTIVKNHKGEILVDSELGKGTTFTIRLPVANTYK